MTPFSGEWWRLQARNYGGLSKSRIEQLTGATFDTTWKPKQSITFGGFTTVAPGCPVEVSMMWYHNALMNAPGLKTAGLILDPGPDMERDVPCGDPNWGDFAKLIFTSGVIYVPPMPATPQISGPIAPRTAVTGIQGPLTSLAPTSTRLEELSDVAVVDPMATTTTKATNLALWVAVGVGIFFLLRR
jgi:hypothetical protein